MLSTEAHALLSIDTPEKQKAYDQYTELNTGRLVTALEFAHYITELGKIDIHRTEHETYSTTDYYIGESDVWLCTPLLAASIISTDADVNHIIYGTSELVIRDDRHYRPSYLTVLTNTDPDKENTSLALVTNYARIGDDFIGYTCDGNLTHIYKAIFTARTRTTYKTPYNCYDVKKRT